MKNVFVLGVCFGTEHTSGMIDIANNFCRKSFPGDRIVNIIINNLNTTEEPTFLNEGAIISGDNSCNEFSGWQVGIKFITESYQPSANDVVLLVNDTIHRRNYALGGSRFYEAYSLHTNETDAHERWAAGFIDDFPKETTIGGLKMQQWIRSNFVVFTYNCVDTISPLVFPAPTRLLFNEVGSSSFWNPASPFSDNWKAYISSWLFGIEDPNFPEYRLKWLKSSSLSLENWESFTKKAICIMSEHYLTARLQKADIKIFDFNNHPKSSDRHTTAYYN